MLPDLLPLNCCPKTKLMFQTNSRCAHFSGQKRNVSSAAKTVNYKIPLRISVDELLQTQRHQKGKRIPSVIAYWRQPSPELKWYHSKWCQCPKATSHQVMCKFNLTTCNGYFDPVSEGMIAFWHVQLFLFCHGLYSKTALAVQNQRPWHHQRWYHPHLKGISIMPEGSLVGTANVPKSPNTNDVLVRKPCAS